MRPRDIAMDARLSDEVKALGEAAASFRLIAGDGNGDAAEGAAAAVVGALAALCSAARSSPNPAVACAAALEAAVACLLPEEGSG